MQTASRRIETAREDGAEQSAINNTYAPLFFVGADNIMSVWFHRKNLSLCVTLSVDGQLGLRDIAARNEETSVTSNQDECNVLFAHESAMFRYAVSSSLSDSDGIVVVANVGTLGEARQSLELHEIDLVMLSTCFQDGSGLEFVQELKSTRPYTCVILLSATDDQDTFLEAVRAGVDGYVVESSHYDRLVRTVRSVIAGKPKYDPAVCTSAIRHLACGHRPTPDQEHQMDLSGLSCRERQVVELMSKGMTNKEIASALSISISTTKTHVSSIFKHLGISFRRELLPRFLSLGEWHA